MTLIQYKNVLDFLLLYLCVENKSISAKEKRPEKPNDKRQIE